MKYLSLVFEEDLHRDDVDRFKTVAGCTGVSVYKNTLNMYFRKIDRAALLSLSAVLQSQIVQSGTGVLLTNATLENSSTRQHIYDALKVETAI